ncbi:uncharacterized protein LOC107606574 [Arachis ipaensis]|uniref:uncharacterized protein LOC107606574 n=1 Tax=Arachis ipaensis TaxID=130454 RepID=UPI0007AF2DBF|nr:uncharacterized protein LOC107606574 [Arachis ipaensis]XP_025628223.1 uncharacterized protein LOC112721366 [Arachis hypogaea]
MWECAKCTTHNKLNAAIEKLKQVCTPAWEYIQKFEPTVWCKAHFSHGPKVDNITNNMCEVWNAKIVQYREKPILTTCEELRCYIMRKMAMHKKKLESHIGPLAPVQHKRLNDFIKSKSHRWRAIWASDSRRILFEVHCQNHKVAVNLQERTYTCNVWQLTGMPCRHTVAIMAKIGLKVEDIVHKWLTIDAIRAQEGGSNTQVNDNPTGGGAVSDVVTKARKAKKKLPKLSTGPETAA